MTDNQTINQLEELLSRNLPEKLVLHKGDAGYAEIGTWDGKERRKHGNSASDALLGEVFKLNIAEALKNCGTLDTKNFPENLPIELFEPPLRCDMMHRYF